MINQKFSIYSLVIMLKKIIKYICEKIKCFMKCNSECMVKNE